MLVVTQSKTWLNKGILEVLHKYIYIQDRVVILRTTIAATTTTGQYLVKSLPGVYLKTDYMLIETSKTKEYDRECLEHSI